MSFTTLIIHVNYTFFPELGSICSSPYEKIISVEKTSFSSYACFRFFFTLLRISALSLYSSLHSLIYLTVPQHCHVFKLIGHISQTFISNSTIDGFLLFLVIHIYPIHFFINDLISKIVLSKLRGCVFLTASLLWLSKLVIPNLYLTQLTSFVSAISTSKFSPARSFLSLNLWQ